MYPSKKEVIGLIAAFLVIIAVLIFFGTQGCAANCNTVMGKPAIWKSYDHMKCSMGKFDRDCADTEIKEIGWWGCKTEIKK